MGNPSEPTDLAAAVRGARRILGLSQVALAERTGISPSYLSRIEGARWASGGPWPSDTVLRALARTLGLSSTLLISLRQRARDAQEDERGPALGRPGPRYSVSMGDNDAHKAACRLVQRSPAHTAIRLTDVLLHDHPRSVPSDGHLEYWEALGAKVASDPDAVLYRVCASTPANMDLVRAKTDHLAGGRDRQTIGNIRTRFCFGNPLALDIVIGEHEALIGIPDRRGHPYLRACLVVDDPDLVAAFRDWYDDFVWGSTCGCSDVRYPTAHDSLNAIEVRLRAASPDTAEPS